MPDREQIIKAIIGLTGMGLLFLVFVGLYWYFVDPFYVPNRPIVEAEGVSLLWSKEIGFNNSDQSGVKFFTPDGQGIVFWSSKLGSGSIVALDLVTGQTLWEVAMPGYRVMRLYDNKIFVTSYLWFDSLEIAPVSKDQVWPDCSFGGRASLLAYDPQTGERLWGYAYQGVDSNDIFFEDQRVYLTGSNDHGASRSIVQIDTNSGEELHLECNKWPNTKEIMRPPKNEGFYSEPFPYRIVYDERDLERQDVFLFFVPEGNRLNILDGITKSRLGYVEFGGLKLSAWYLDVAVQNEVVVVYLGDSDQLFGFRLPQLAEMRRTYENNKTRLEENSCGE